MKNTHSSSKRLESLDALRGFDLFFLVALGPLMHSLARTANMEWLNESMWVFIHIRQATFIATVGKTYIAAVDIRYDVPRQSAGT